MLTKEQCEKALYELSLMTAIAEKEECNGCSCESCGLRKDSECKGNSYLWYFKKLIEEHFSNPPLKFEELNKGYPIYDNDEIVCGWKFIYMIDKEYKQLLLIDEEGNVNWVNYEENRFYRKEVQE